MVYRNRINVKKVMPLCFVEQIDLKKNNKAKLPNFVEIIRKLKYLG